MAVAFVNQGAASVGTTSITPAYPASIAAGDLLLLYVVTKFLSSGPVKPSGFFLRGSVTGGAGASGVDSGELYCTLYTRIADGTETGTVTVSIPFANVSMGRIIRFTKDANHSWNLNDAAASDNTAGIDCSFATGTITTGTGILFACAGLNGDAYTSVSGQAIAQAGITIGTETERNDTTTTIGDDLGMVASTHVITAGTGSAGITYTFTAAAAVGNCPAGAACVLMLRELLDSTGSPPLPIAIAGGAASITFNGTGSPPLPVAVAAGAASIRINGSGTAPLPVAVAAGSDGLINPDLALLRLDWDSANDWNGLTFVNGAELSKTRVISPVIRYLGGEGRLASAWTGAGGLTDVYAGAPLTPKRTLQASFALRVESITWVGGGTQTRKGPVMIRARSPAAADLGWRLALQVTTTAAGLITLALTDTSSGSTSATTVELRARNDAWLIVRIEALSSGAAEPYTVTYAATVIEARGSVERELGRMTIAAPATDAYDFSEVGIGWLALDKNDDAFVLHFDHVQAMAGGSVPLPPPRRGGPQADRLAVRLRRFDDALDEWVVAWEFAPHDVRALECSFLAHRVEESARVMIQDPGAVWSNRIQDVLADTEQRGGRGCRLDIYQPEVAIVDPMMPAGWIDESIYWSGIVDTRAMLVNVANRTVEITAIGWTAMLDRVVVTRRRWSAGTLLSTIITDVAVAIDADWPGVGSLQPDDAGSSIYTAKTIAVIEARARSAADILNEIASLGAYFFGVSVSGYPATDAAEFRFIFNESRTSLRAVAAAPTAAGAHGDYVQRTVDLEDPSVISFSIDNVKDFIASRFVFNGSPLTMSLVILPTILAPDRTSVRHSSLYDVAEYAGSQFSGFSGAAFQYVGSATAPTEGTVGIPGTQSGGVVYPVDPELAVPFLIVSDARNSAAYVDLALDRAIPAPTSTTGNGTLIAEITGGIVRAQATIEDLNRSSTVLKSSEVVVDQAVRGTYTATVAAIQLMWSRARNARSATLVVRSVVGTPGDMDRNRINVIDGRERITRFGTASAGGDAWGYGDDERPLGSARTFEVRGVSVTRVDGGWDMTFQLGSTAIELASRLSAEVI